MSIKISVVVPVYNAEKYLRACIDSILSQTFQEFEVIFVDDGSTDQSCEILESYRLMNNRITVFHQHNSFAGTARNRGLKYAKGKYVIFLDCDDFFVNTMLSQCYETAERDQADIVCFGHYTYNDLTHQELAEEYQSQEKGLLKESEKQKLLWNGWYGMPWNKFYLRSFIQENELSFQDIRNTNDELFVRTAFLCSSRVVFLQERLVYYRVNNSESLQGTTNKDLTCAVRFLVELKKEMIKRGRWSSQEEYFSVFAKRILKQQFGYNSFLAIEPLYEYTKAVLIPDIFESKAKLEQQKIGLPILESDSFTHFLWLKCKLQEENMAEMQKNTIPMYSWDYRIGKAIMKVPRAVLKKVKKSGKNDL